MAAFPAAWMDPLPHTHVALDDALEQGALFCNMLTTLREREAALAKRLGTDKGMQIGLDGVQLLGGHGFVKEHPVERWYRDLRAIGIMEGTVLV